MMDGDKDYSVDLASNGIDISQTSIVNIASTATNTKLKNSEQVSMQDEENAVDSKQVSRWNRV